MCVIYFKLRQKYRRTKETLYYGISKSPSFTCDNKWFEPVAKWEPVFPLTQMQIIQLGKKFQHTYHIAENLNKYSNAIKICESFTLITLKNLCNQRTLVYVLLSRNIKNTYTSFPFSPFSLQQRPYVLLFFCLKIELAY